MKSNNPNLDQAQAQQMRNEATRWDEGGVYRVALHTATAFLATGNLQGGLSAGATAYAIPRIDDHLKDQGFDKETRDTVLLTLSAGLGGAIGDSTASVINNVGQVEWNYLTHRQLDDKKQSCSNMNMYCDMKKVEEYDDISKAQDERLRDVCAKNPASEVCQKMMRSALEYVGRYRGDDHKKSDITRSTQEVLSVANSSGYNAIKNLDDRINYFGAMYAYTDQPWFRVAENESRGWFSLRGANYFGFSD